MPSYMSETVATRRDKGDNTLCGECSSPHNLKLCSGMPPPRPALLPHKKIVMILYLFVSLMLAGYDTQAA